MRDLDVAHRDSFANRSFEVGISQFRDVKLSELKALVAALRKMYSGMEAQIEVPHGRVILPFLLDDQLFRGRSRLFSWIKLRSDLPCSTSPEEAQKKP